MLDCNNREIKIGDVVRVSGGYFKSSNGLFFVSDDYFGQGGSVWLHRIKKNGEPCVNSATSTESWPLSSYCSDARKNRAARAHNAENAKIEIVDGVNTWHIAENFRKRAQEYRERAERARQNGWGEDEVSKSVQSAERFESAVARLEETAEQPKRKEPEKGVRFYWNGIKVDGGRLIPCWYSLNNNSDNAPSVSISAKDYGGDLPREYFTVENESDIYTDYFEKDHTTMTPEHPLYRFARYVALKGMANKKTYNRMTEAQAEEWAKMKDPGQPTADDIKAVEDMKTAAESARKAAEHAEQLAEREKSLRKISEGRHYCEGMAAEHPIKEGQPTVEIGFSESPYLYSLSHGAENVFSVAAAEIILKHYDEMKHAENAGYDKTDFVISYNDPQTGEAKTYEGRYDLGDNDGGLIEHIRAFGKSQFHSSEGNADICELADYLEAFTEGGRVVNVEIAPGVIDLLEYRKKREQEKRENDKREWADIMAAVQMLTDEQIEAAVFAISPEDKEKIDVARFFLQELSRRDEQRALDVFRRWQAGA